LSNHRVVAPYIRDAVPGSVSGRLVDCGAYPALVAVGSGSPYTVRGLWLTVEPEALGPLDRLEEFFGTEEPNDYDRVWVRDRTLPLEGWTYVWPDARGLAYIPDDYWPDYRNRKRTGG